MEVPPRLPLTDSPWFWVLVFSGMALVALLAMGPKYGGRQSRIEQKYQARERILEQRATPNREGSTEVSPERMEEQGERRGFATAENTLIPLWPLAVILSLLMVIAVVMLFRGRGRPGSLGEEGSS
jgi:hypothetical protein